MNPTRNSLAALLLYVQITTPADLPCFSDDSRSRSSSTSEDKALFTAWDLNPDFEESPKSIAGCDTSHPFSTASFQPFSLPQTEKHSWVGRPKRLRCRKIHACSITPCGYEAASINRLIKHHRSKHKALCTFNCKTCESLFFTQELLGKHTCKKQSCICSAPHCTYTALYIGHLVEHIQASHIELCRFKCTFCAEAFFTDRRLDEHKQQEHASR